MPMAHAGQHSALTWVFKQYFGNSVGPSQTIPHVSRQTDSRWEASVFHTTRTQHRRHKRGLTHWRCDDPATAPRKFDVRSASNWGMI